MRIGDDRVKTEIVNRNAAFDCLLPALHAGAALHDVQEPQGYVEMRMCAAEGQTFHLKIRPVRTRLPDRPSFRIQYAEIPALSILQSRRPVRIKNIAFVQNGARDLVHQF